MSTFGNLLIKLILKLLLSFKLQNIKRKQLIRKAKSTLSAKSLWFSMHLQLHILWKTLPLKNLFVQYTVCFDPFYMVKNQDESIRGFGLLSGRIRSLKQLPSSEYVEKQSGNKWKYVEIFYQRFSHFTFREVKF